MKTPNYVLDEDYRYGPTNDPKVLKAGCFVRPIDISYVPKHCKENRLLPHFHGYDTFCYTPHGIIPIPLKIIRKLE